MISRSHDKYNLSGHRWVFVILLCLFGLYVWSEAAPRGKTAKDNRVYLVHADQLYYDRFSNNPEAQIAKGNVHFSHQGAHLWCDSAYFYQASNSVKAFGKVRFRQGDTLSLTCNYAEYNGEEQQMAARRNVVLRHRKQTLYCDSLNYDRLYNYAYFFEGGTLIDGKDKLVSDWGEYRMDSRQAVFYYNVKMRSADRVISTDTLYYDTRQSLAHIVGPNSTIQSKDGIINTVNAYYDNKTDKARLYSRSVVEDKQKSVVADTLLYVKDGNSAGYGNVVYVDKENKNSLLCDELHYNEATGEGFATKNAVMKEFSQGADTLYAHADSIKLYTFNINTDSVYRKVHCYHKVRAYRTDIQAVCDSLVYSSADSCVTLYKDPVVWNDNKQLLGEEIQLFMNDSTIRLAKVVGQALSVEELPDKKYYNQVASKVMNAYFEQGKIQEAEAVGNVKSIYFPIDDKDSSYIGLNNLETDTMRLYIGPDRKMKKVWTCKFTSTLYPMTQIPPGKQKLDTFAWFSEMRPKDKDDIFNWRPKSLGTQLKNIERHEAPLQSLDEP